MKAEVTIRKKDGNYKFCFLNSGNKKEMKYFKIEGLKEPNWSVWDNKKFMFNEPTKEAIYNNKLIGDRMRCYKEIAKHSKYDTLENLIDIIKASTEITENKTFTVGDFLDSIIEEKKHPKNKKPSRNYEAYETLKNKLIQEGCIIELPIQEINRIHFVRLSDFIINQPNRRGEGNYSNNMKKFKALINIAFERGLNDNNIKFDISKNAPIIHKKEKTILTNEQYNKFLKLDLSKIKHGYRESEYYKELYRDFCIFVCESKMRPIDSIQAKYSQIHKPGINTYIRYIPEKKKNTDKTQRETNAIMTERTKAIIKKYEEKSKLGYIFPFALNDTETDTTNSKEWIKRDKCKQKTFERINLFLKKVATHIGIEPEKFTIYSFRHTGITMEARKKGKNISEIAKEAGTSIMMIDNTYYHQNIE